MTIKFTDEALENIKERGIQQGDVEIVINAAEANNVKIISDEGSNLCRSKVGNYTVYAEYKLDGDEAEVVDAYSHRVTLVSLEED
ncbi:MAG: hypothetical protein ACPKNR_14350 [Pleomorphochaeta sp.]